MIVTKGFLAGRIITQGYGPEVTAPLSAIDTGYKGLATRGFESLTKTRSAKVLTKRTVSEK